MNKVKLIQAANPAVLVGAVMLLASCGGDNTSSVVVHDVRPSAGETPASRIVFDASAGDIPLPSDLLFSGTSDGTLEVPDEVDARAAGVIDYSDPAVALGVADGWSTIFPMQVSLDMAESATLDATTVGAETVVLIETSTPPLDGSLGACQIPDLSVGLPCGVVAPLTYGVDFVAVAGDDTITIAPLKPLKAKTTYVVGILDGVLDSRGEAVLASEQYEQVTRGDVDISFPSLDSLQDAVNLYEAIIDIGTGGTGATPEDALFSAAWTTASVGDSVVTATSVLAATPPSVSSVTDTGVTVETALIAEGALPAEAAGTTPLRYADLYSASVTLPYYSGTPADGSDPLVDNWMARCDNPLAIQGAAEAGVLPDPVEPNNSVCNTINASLGDYGLDTERHLTKYNPVPLVRDNVTLEVQITVPNTHAAPWPVVILQHGITSKKEDMLAVTGALAGAGFATFAIDHPLHGSRALESESAGASVSAGMDATVYMNLANLPVARDNLNQSMADMLAFRMAIASDITGDLGSTSFDTDEVHVLGMSLGGISSVGFVALASSLGLDIQSAALIVPGGGIAPLLSESPAFGSLVQGSVLASAGTDLSSTFISFMSSNSTCAGDIGCNFDDFVATLDAVSLAEISGMVSQFIFAAQTLVDPADPINFAASLADLATPLYMAEIVGDGVNNLSDQVIPNQTVTPGITFGGTEPLASFLGLSGVDANNAPQSSGIVRFTAGGHSSLLSSADSADTTTEMQTQVAGFLSGAGINITNTAVVQELP